MCVVKAWQRLTVDSVALYPVKVRAECLLHSPVISDVLTLKSGKLLVTLNGRWNGFYGATFPVRFY